MQRRQNVWSLYMVLDWIIDWIFEIVVIVIVVILFWLAWCGIWYWRHPCIRSHMAWVHYNEWIQIIPIDKTTTIIVHPARDEWESVCDERKP